MTSKANTTVAIVGGGLGGLTLAIALGQSGYDGTSFTCKCMPRNDEVGRCQCMSLSKRPSMEHHPMLRA
jgi:2-polyprenyl-6-methoxyphenol hydroxylase-like FAD-dependent oxidoreductase